MVSNLFGVNFLAVLVFNSTEERRCISASYYEQFAIRTSENLRYELVSYKPFLLGTVLAYTLPTSLAYARLVPVFILL